MKGKTKVTKKSKPTQKMAGGLQTKKKLKGQQRNKKNGKY